MPYVNKGVNHPRSLKSAFVVHLLDSIIPAISIIPICKLSLTWSLTFKERFSCDVAHIISPVISLIPGLHYVIELNRRTTKPAKLPVCPARTLTSLGICPV